MVKDKIFCTKTDLNDSLPTPVGATYLLAQMESDGLMKAVSMQAASTMQLELSSDATTVIVCQQPGIRRHFSTSKYPGLTAADLEDLRRRGFKHTAQSSRQPLISQDNNSLDCVSDATLSKEQVNDCR